MFITGLVIFAATYFGMAFTKDSILLYILFFLYGLYAACTEGVSKAWISNSCKPEDTATAIGTYEGLRSIMTILASSLAGLVWFYSNPAMTFMVTSIAVVIIVGYFTVCCHYSPHQES